MDNSNSSNEGFFKYVFNFDDNTKSEVLNIMQYSVLSLIPIVILNKTMQRYVPEADEQKGSLEILAEVVMQTFVLFLGLFFVNRLVTFLPTYSGAKYPEFNVVNITLVGLVILLSLQTKLGEKVSILCDRVSELWEGTTNKKSEKKNNQSSGSVKVIQPISQTQSSQQSAITQSLYGGNGTSQVNNLPDYNSTYVNANDASALIGNTTPGMESMSNIQQQSGSNEPMAANAALGGGGFGSW